MKKYFSFIGNVICRKYEIPDELIGDVIHHIQGTCADIFLYKVKGKPNLVLLCKYTRESQTDYLCLKNSFDCLPAVPIFTFGDDLRNALNY